MKSVSTIKKVLILACALSLLMPAVGNAANTFYVTIKGTNQGTLKQSNRRGIPALGYSHMIQSPRDLATGRASGKRQHGAITISKEWDASSPQLFQALVTNEKLSKVTFSFYNTSPEGSEQVYYTVTLTNAFISKIEYKGGTENAATRDPQLEYVSFTYSKIEVENKTGHTMATDDWTK